MIRFILNSTLQDLKEDKEDYKKDRDYYMDKYKEYYAYYNKLQHENIRLANKFGESVKKSKLYKELKEDNKFLKDKIELLENRLKSLKEYKEKLND